MQCVWSWSADIPELKGRAAGKRAHPGVPGPIHVEIAGEGGAVLPEGHAQRSAVCVRVAGLIAEHPVNASDGVAHRPRVGTGPSARQRIDDAPGMDGPPGGGVPNCISERDAVEAVGMSAPRGPCVMSGMGADRRAVPGERRAHSI